MEKLDCKILRDRIMEELKEKTQALSGKGIRTPSLAVVLVGTNPASKTYVKNKQQACQELGYLHYQYNLDEDCMESDLLSLIDKLNDDEEIDGILVQLPLPRHIDEKKVIERIKRDKDVDGFTPLNQGNMLLGLDSYIPCTPKGILKIIDFFGVETKGKRVAVIGRSNIVGKPISVLLMARGRDATVTVCNSCTTDVKSITKECDIIIVAIGKPEAIDSSYAKDDAVIIDVGINRVEDSTKKKGYRIVGDVDIASFENTNARITPVPGGVGLMTVAMLMENTYQARIRKN